MPTSKPLLERAIERGLFASRWLLAPIYLGLVVVLAADLRVLRPADGVMDWVAGKITTH